MNCALLLRNLMVFFEIVVHPSSMLLQTFGFCPKVVQQCSGVWDSFRVRVFSVASVRLCAIARCKLHVFTELSFERETFVCR